MIPVNVLRNSVSYITRRRLIHSSGVVKTSEANDTHGQDTRYITKDRTEEVPVETSIRYLKSPAFQQTYGVQPVWVLYRRNFKGLIPPKKTRRTCIRGGQIATGNPCPICRDEYLVLHEENTELLKQFICPHTGSVLSYEKTGICQKKHQQLLVAVERAHDRGYLTFDVPFRKYDYLDYMKSD